MPALMELRSPTSMKSDEPTSRTVVKPAITVLRALAVARIACSEIGRCSESRALAVVIGIEIVGQMRVRVDEAGKQRGIAQIDDGGAGRSILAADGLNHAV